MGDKVYRRRKGVVVARQLDVDELVMLTEASSVMGHVDQYIVEDGITTKIMDAAAFEALYSEVK